MSRSNLKSIKRVVFGITVLMLLNASSTLAMGNKSYEHSESTEANREMVFVGDALDKNGYRLTQNEATYLAQKWCAEQTNQLSINKSYVYSSAKCEFGAIEAGHITSSNRINTRFGLFYIFSPKGIPLPSTSTPYYAPSAKLSWREIKQVDANSAIIEGKEISVKKNENLLHTNSELAETNSTQ